MASQPSDKSNSVMAQLLAKHKDSFTSVKKGETLKGTLTKLTSSEILVDIGAKSEAFVLEKDKRILRYILSLFKSGDKVEVSVLNPESESGQPVVSLRRYLGNLSWKKLEELDKSKDQIEVTVTDTSKAGYLVSTDFGITGFLPQSHISSGQQDIKPGVKVKVSVLELNREDNKIIFTQKTVISEDEFKNAIGQFETGKKISVEINNVTPVGIFVTLPAKKTEKKSTTLEGFIHVSEISWEKVEDPTELYTQGQKIEAVITKSDPETRRINLSMKRLSKDPFEALMEEYPVDKKVTGTVTSVDENGVTVAVAEGVEGVIKKDKIPPGTSYTEGQQINATVSEHDKKRHKISLTPVLLEKPIGYR